MKHDLYDVLSHEVASFVRGMTSGFDLIQEHRRKFPVDLGAELTAALAGIEDQVRELDRLQKKLDELCRIGETAPCDLCEVIAGIRVIFALQFNKRQVALIFRHNHQMSVAVPFTTAFLALFHVVRNAFEAMAERGFIDIDIVDGTDHAICTVRDSGPGVAEAVKSNLFDRGTTTKVDHSAGKRGSGLADSREALLQSGATIELANPGPGGTIFTITFPKHLQESRDGK
ncbi:MAG: HAMP domain-containing histidine kinase [Thermoanaerobaculia bacterium]|nr:HAMP domain-containing histidine kinase [Thermoanaerobaculia bacterium]